MSMRHTPFFRLRYPWTDDLVNAADIQAMGNDIDQSLVQTGMLANNFLRMSSVAVRRAAAQSITKATLTTITFDTVLADNGVNSPLANGPWWAAGAPTRLTAPSPCIVLASAYAGMNQGAAWGSPASFQIAVALNGAVAVGVGLQGSKYAPTATASGQTPHSALTMWKLVAGDFLELKLHWNGTPAGPINTDTFHMPQLALMMVALPSVP
jgi:hypothetical protein